MDKKKSSRFYANKKCIVFLKCSNNIYSQKLAPVLWMLHFKSIIGVNSISATNIREMNTILQIRKWVYQQANNINTIVMSVQIQWNMYLSLRVWENLVGIVFSFLFFFFVVFCDLIGLFQSARSVWWRKRRIIISWLTGCCIAGLILLLSLPPASPIRFTTIP